MGDEAIKPFLSSKVLMFQLSELNPAFQADVHGALDRQRADNPVEHDAFLPAVLITAHEPARKLLLAPTLSRNFDFAGPNNPVAMGLRRLNQAVEAEFGRHESMLTLDGEDHARVRGVIAETFLKRASLSQNVIGEVVNQALDRLVGRERFDVVNDYAARIPIRILGRLLGCDEADADQLRAWTEAGQVAFDPTNSEETHQRAVEGRRGILTYFARLMRARTVEPREDVVSDLLAARAAGAPISDNEILHNLFALLVAGHLTTADLIGNGVYLLLSNKLSRDPALATAEGMGAAVEEILRYEPPISITARFPAQAGETSGCPYAAGDALTVQLMAANRDPAKFDNPHAFDIHREHNAHLAFGAGAHICVGAPLARLEAATALSALFARFPKLRLAQEGAPQWRWTPGVRGLARLEVMAL